MVTTYLDRRRIRKMGISTVVVEVLLAILGIAAVIIVWWYYTTIMTRLDFQIISARIQKIGNVWIARVEIMNTGTLDITSIQEVRVVPSGSITLSLGQETIKAGQSKTFVDSNASGFKVGDTYVIIITCKGDGRTQTREITVTATTE